MKNDPTTPSQEFLASIQPIVLVGGKSTRFGRDKLREPMAHTGERLVQRPIAALRAVFGPRVRLVGECHPSLLSLADGIISDQFPGTGPLGGVLSALQLSAGPVFVLAGDMPAFDADSIQAIVAAAWRDASAIAVWACSGREHPCAGLYTKAATPLLASALNERRFTLRDAIPARDVRLIPIEAAKVMNVNRPDELSLSPALALPAFSAPDRTTTLPRTDTR